MNKLFSSYSQRGFSSITLLLLISLLFSVSSQNAKKKLCQTEECLDAAKNFKNSANFSADPCDDFYKYACGNWLRNPDEPQNSTFQSRGTENDLEILAFLKQNNSNDEPEAVHKARKFFNLCQNEEAYKNDLKQIETTLQKIGIPVDSLVSNKTVAYDYTTALAKAARLTEANLYFNLEVLPNAYNQTEDIITISLTVQEFDSSDSTEEQDKYEEIERMCGNNTSPSCKRLLLLLSFAKNLTTDETVNQESETLNSSLPVTYNLKQLQNLTDDIAAEINATIATLNWTRYIEELFTDSDTNVTLDLNNPNKLLITIGELDSVKEMIKSIHKKQNTKIIAYELLQEVIYTLQPYVNSYGKTELNCSKLTANSLEWAVSYMYTKNEKYVKAKTETRQLFENLRDAIHQLIEQASWMDETTRHRALKKLYWMRSNIAYPSIITNSSALDDYYKDVKITDNFLESKQSIQKPRSKRVTENRRDDTWVTPPNTVNAFYEPKTNNIYIPAAILGFSFFNGLHALYYGSIGYVLGHEMTHGFDNTGRGYNETGYAENWWQNTTEELYREKAKCFVQANRNYTATSSGPKRRPNRWNYVDRLNLGEDLSDNVGFKESLLAYRKLVNVSGEELSLPEFENFTHEQLFTLAFANFWCENPSSSKFMSTLGDEHSAKEFRINGVLQNSKEFPIIWKCPKGSKMNPSDDKCEIW